MRIVTLNKKALVLEANNKEAKSNSFVFSLNLVPDYPEPKSFIIIQLWGKRIKEWKMSWNKFMNQTAFDDLALLRKRDMSFNWRTVKK